MHKRTKNIVAIALTCILTYSGVASNITIPQKTLAKQITLGNKENMSITINDVISHMVKYYENGYINQVGKNINALQWVALNKAGVKDFSKWTVNNKVENLNSKVVSLRLSAKAKQSMLLMDLGKDPSNFEGMNLIQDTIDDINEMLKGIYTSSIQTPGGQAEAMAIIAINRFNKMYPEKKVEFKSTTVSKFDNKIIHKDDQWIVDEMASGKKTSVLRDNIPLIQMLSYYKNKENINENINKFLNLFKESLKDDGGIYDKSIMGDIYATFTQVDFIDTLLRIGEDPTKWSKNGHNLIDGMFIKWDGKCFRNYDNLKDIGDLDKVFYILTLLKEKGYGEYKLNNVNFKNIDYTKDALIEKIEISPSKDKKQLEIGDKLQFKANITPINAINKDKIRWISSNEKVIRIDNNGLVTAVGAGEADIFIWVTGKFVESNKYRIKVNPLNVSGVKIDKDKIQLKINELARLNAKILPKNASNQKVIWTSSDENIVKVDKSGLLTAKSKGKAIITVTTEDGGFEDKCEVEVIGLYKDSKVNYEKVIDDICKNIDFNKINIKNKDLNNIDYWTILDLSKAGKNLPKDYLKSLTYKIKNSKDIILTSQWAKVTLGVLALGGEPINVDGINVIEKIYNGDMESIYDYAFGLIALDSGNYGIPENAKYNRDKIINNILSLQTNNNGWALVGDREDIDTTAMVIAALAPYYNKRSDVKNSVDKALKLLSLNQGIEGEFKNAFGNENSNTTAMVIIALCSLGINPCEDERFIKGGNNLIDVLMGYRTLDEKGFGFIDQNYNTMATEQGLRALVSYKNLQENKKSIYRFNIEDNKKIFRIEDLTDKSKIKSAREGKVVVRVTNLSEENKDASLIIGLFNKNGKLLDYVSTKENIKSGEDSELMGMLSIPKTGEYTLKAFVWDDIKNMNKLSDVIEIPIK